MAGKRCDICGILYADSENIRNDAPRRRRDNFWEMSLSGQEGDGSGTQVEELPAQRFHQ